MDLLADKTVIRLMVGVRLAGESTFSTQFYISQEVWARKKNEERQKTGITMKNDMSAVINFLFSKSDRGRPTPRDERAAQFPPTLLPK